MTKFPMPNDRLGDSTVVASVTYRDEPTEIATVLLLNKEPPFFTVAHYYLEAIEASGMYPARAEGELEGLGDEYNIVPAVEWYQQSGGDY
jgi:hypothetical protein